MKEFTVLLMALSLFACPLGAAEILYDKAECWTYEGQKEKPVCDSGVFTLKGQLHFFGKELVPVEPGKSYSVTAEIRNPKEEKLPGVCIAVVFVDDKGKPIPTREYLAMPGTETELAAPAGMTDTTLTVKANPEWKKHKQWNYVVAFDAKEDKSDLPNPKVSTVITNFAQDGDNIKVTLGKPLYAEFPAGAKVRLHHSGSFYLPCPKDAWYNFAGKEWKTVGGDFNVPANAKRFRPAIIYYDKPNTVKYFEMRNFKLTAR